MNIPQVLTFAWFKGDKWHDSRFDKHFSVGFFSGTVSERYFKLSMIIILMGVYRYIPGLVTLTLFQDQRCVKTVNCKLCWNFRFLRAVKKKQQQNLEQSWLLAFWKVRTHNWTHVMPHCPINVIGLSCPQEKIFFFYLLNITITAVAVCLFA